MLVSAMSEPLNVMPGRRVQKSILDTITEELEGVVSSPFQAEETAAKLVVIFNNWRAWQEVISGMHGCHTEHCLCTKVIETAKAYGWADTRPAPRLHPVKDRELIEDIINELTWD